MKDELVNGTCIASSAILTATQTDTILRYIQLGLTILSVIITTAYTIYKWHSKAKEDGKITKDEIKEGINIIQDGLDGIKDSLDNKEENKK